MDRAASRSSRLVRLDRLLAYKRSDLVRSQIRARTARGFAHFLSSILLTERSGRGARNAERSVAALGSGNASIVRQDRRYDPRHDLRNRCCRRHARRARWPNVLVTRSPYPASVGTDHGPARNRAGAGNLRRMDVFVHATVLERSGIYALSEGQRVTFELQTDRRTGKTSTANLKLAA